MEKIINYISRGQGLGIKFLLLFSLIVAVFYAVGTKFAGDQFFVPAAQKAADAFLPIRIENGIVTEPENTVKNYTFVLGEGKVPDAESFNLTMDTTVDSLDTSGLKEGLYLTKRALYVVQRTQTRVRICCIFYPLLHRRHLLRYLFVHCFRHFQETIRL